MLSANNWTGEIKQFGHETVDQTARAVLLIKEPLILEHFVIDTIAVIKCPFSKRKSRVNIIRSNRDKIVGSIYTGNEILFEGKQERKKLIPIQNFGNIKRLYSF